MTPIFEDVLRDMLIEPNLVGNRVYLLRAPEQAVPPYIVFGLVGPEPLHSQSGALDIIVRMYQVSFFDTSQSRAILLGDSLRHYWDGWRGMHRDVEIGAFLYRLQTQQYEDDTRLWQVIQHYRITYREPAEFSAAVQSVVNSERKRR